jgi:hypothetical protein
MEYRLLLTVSGHPAAAHTVHGDTPAELARVVRRHARGLAGTQVDVRLHGGQLTGTLTRHGALCGTFELTPSPPSSPEPLREPMHGYTLHDLHDIALTVIRKDQWLASDAPDRYAAVWHALAEHLCTSKEPPTRRDLISIGLRAGDRHVKEETHHHGKTFDHGPGVKPMPGFERFWHASPTPSHETQIVERLACEQIWPLLAPRQREALDALALHGTYQAAAAAIGARPATFESLIRDARRRFYRWWHEGETAPRRPWRRDIRVRSRTDKHGRPRLTESQVDALRARYDGGEKLRAVAADAGVPLSTLSALLRGTRRPAPDPPESAAALATPATQAQDPGAGESLALFDVA